jgi:hypothetical protein
LLIELTQYDSPARLLIQAHPQLERAKLTRILQESGFISLDDNNYARLVSANVFVASEDDNPGCPLPDDKKAILIRAIIREKSHTFVSCVSSLFAHLDETFSSYSIMSINSNLMGCKLAKINSAICLISSFNCNLYHDCDEHLVKEAITDMRTGADLAYKIVHD